MTLFSLASRQNEYLAQRQSLIAQNVANANVPGYRAKDLEKFEDALQSTAATMPLATTNPMHLQLASMGTHQAQAQNVGGSEVHESGNDVSLEKEFLKSGEVTRTYSLNTQIVKAFNRMLMSAAKT